MPVGQEREMRNPRDITQEFDGKLQGIQRLLMGLLLVLVREI